MLLVRHDDNEDEEEDALVQLPLSPSASGQRNRRFDLTSSVEVSAGSCSATTTAPTARELNPENNGASVHMRARPARHTQEDLVENHF